MATKLELQQALDARNQELEQARLLIAKLEGDVAMLRRKQAAAPVERTALTPFRAACAAAREMAMRTGRSVVVGDRS